MGLLAPNPVCFLGGCRGMFARLRAFQTSVLPISRNESFEALLTLRNHCNARNGMDLHPLGVVCVLHIRSHNAHVGPHRWNLHWTVVGLGTRWLGVRLSHVELAVDFEH